jgi:signal transduction histidine kinase
MNQVSDIVAETDALIDGWRARAMGIVVGALITFMPPWIGAEEAGEPARELKRVLILESFGRDFALWDAVPPTFKPELVQQLPWPIEFHEAALETARSDQAQAEPAFAEYLRALYAGRRPDLVVPIGAPAAQFLWRHRTGLFPQTPVLIGGIDQRMLSTLSLGSNDTAVVARMDMAACFEILWQLFPATTNLAMVLGDSPHERLWVAECRKAFQAYTNRLQIIWLNGLSFPEMCRRVASLPPGSAIAYGSLLVDAAGVPHEQMEALERLCTVANAPVLGTEEEELGHGIIGGSLVSGRALGLETARLAARVLRGEPPGSIAPPVIGPGPPIFDWRQLQRWHIADRQLPPGSIVRFRQPSAWERYRRYIVSALVIISAQAVTIMGLVVHRARRRAAEASAYELAGRLIGVQENERRDIAAKLHDGLGQDLLVIASQAQLSLRQPENPPATVQRLNEIAKTAKQAILQARQMAHNLRPGLLDELGLTKAIRATANKAGQAAGLSMDVSLADVDGLLPPEFEVNLFRIIQETLNNILKHAGASQTKITLTRERAHLRLVVEDDGRGFDASRLASLAPDQRGLGLHEIAERVKMMRGRVVIQSRPGQGTRLTVEVPTSRTNSGR